MSAQRSRIKQKIHFKKIEKENSFLKAKINNLTVKNQQVTNENVALKQEIELLKEKIKGVSFNLREPISNNLKR